LDLRIDMSASAGVRACPVEPIAARVAIGTPGFQHVKWCAPPTGQVPGGGARPCLN
jgi:hypothetical protein